MKSRVKQSLAQVVEALAQGEPPELVDIFEMPSIGNAFDRVVAHILSESACQDLVFPRKKADAELEYFTSTLKGAALERFNRYIDHLDFQAEAEREAAYRIGIEVGRRQKGGTQ